VSQIKSGFGRDLVVSANGQGESRKRATVPVKFRPLWLKRSDQRRTEIRVLTARMAAIASDLGGYEDLSSVRQSLLERFAHCEGLILGIESRARESKPIDLQAYLALIDRLIRLSVTIGLDRKSRRLPSPLEYAARLTPAQANGHEVASNHTVQTITAPTPSKRVKSRHDIYASKNNTDVAKTGGTGV
jgi:hypothetical protein